jgi:predicted nuclease of predicted toxin-antitoxin system
LKLLFDQNLSPRLVAALNDLFPTSSHVQTLEPDRATDAVVWDYAKHNDFAIVTKDIDFYEQSLLFGSPPKIIWIRRGNCATREIEQCIRANLENISKLNHQSDLAAIILS